MSRLDKLTSECHRAPTTHAEAIAAAKAILVANGMTFDSCAFPARDGLNPRWFIWTYYRNGSSYDIRTDYGVLSERDLATFVPHADAVDAERKLNPHAYCHHLGAKPWPVRGRRHGAQGDPVTALDSPRAGHEPPR